MAFIQRSEVRETLRLAAPVMLARSGLPMIVIVDSLFVGRLGAEELAYLSLGIAPTLMLMLVGVGVLQGGMILMAQAFGAGEQSECGKIWRVNLVHAIGIGIVFGLLCLAVHPLLIAAGIAPDLAKGAARVAFHVGWSMPFMLVFIACQYFFETIKQPLWGLVLIAAANLLNIPLNYLLVFGWGEILPMGAAGATLGSSILRCFLGLAVLVVISRFRTRDIYGIHLRLRGIGGEASRDIGRRLRRLGAPVGFVQFVETSTMTSLTLMAGKIGAVAAASFQITVNVIQLVYMTAIGMAAATAIRVAHAVGDNNSAGVRTAGFHAAFLMGLLIIPICILIEGFPLTIASAFTSDSAVLDLARYTVRIAGVVILFHTLMAVFLGGLRGVGDVHVTLRIQTAFYWGIVVPSAYYFAFAQKWGVPGLIFGLFLGVFMACTTYALRFNRISVKKTVRH